MSDMTSNMFALAMSALAIGYKHPYHNDASIALTSNGPRNFQTSRFTQCLSQLLLQDQCTTRSFAVIIKSVYHRLE